MAHYFHGHINMIRHVNRCITGREFSAKGAVNVLIKRLL